MHSGKSTHSVSAVNSSSPQADGKPRLDLGRRDRLTKKQLPPKNTKPGSCAESSLAYYYVKTNKTQAEYTAYGTAYQVCLPLDMEIMIPSDEPLRLLSAVTEELDYSRLIATYSRLGRIEYPPRLLFKISHYASTREIYGMRGIERACRENVNFMYLLEGHKPSDHNSIARFRKEHLPYAVEDLLAQMVRLLMKHGEISFE